jgi:hypothetical protein
MAIQKNEREGDYASKHLLINFEFVFLVINFKLNNFECVGNAKLS